jgi:protoporphyrinogen oxidase
MVTIGASYARARVAPRSPEVSLEDFLINRFGRELYMTFFRDYTEKVWGVPCSEIAASGVRNGSRTVDHKGHWHMRRGMLLPHNPLVCAKRLWRRASSCASCILSSAPGQLWEEVARRVKDGEHSY